MYVWDSVLSRALRHVFFTYRTPDSKVSKAKSR